MQPEFTYREYKTGAEMRAAYRAVRARTWPVKPVSPVKPGCTEIQTPISVRAETRAAHATAILTLKPHTPAHADLVSLIKTVAHVTKYSVRDLIGEDRRPQIRAARQIFMWLARYHVNASYPQIAEVCCRDHSTVMNGVRVISATKEKHAETIALIIERLEGLREQQAVA